ncbi:MAG TPA: hypothetical protein DD473_25015 [Planctomycetaceae bacterium]|nr:hypothetical protein [Planctomycetaceae bacterium]|tara:strand:- start:3510 stop:3773 length:264 start_codon:yes stop_codon:yes gene_type:complete
MKKNNSETVGTTRKNIRTKKNLSQSDQIDREELLPILAMKALDEATQQAINSGDPIVFTRNGMLYLRTADGKEKFIKSIKNGIANQD